MLAFNRVIQGKNLPKKIFTLKYDQFLNFIAKLFL